MGVEFMKDPADNVGIPTLQGMVDAAEILKVLGRHYPGYRWAVDFDETQRVIKIINFTLLSPLSTRELYGYIFHVPTLSEDKNNGWKKLIRAGGEMLERANMDRKAWDQHTLPSKIDGVKGKHQPLLDSEGKPIIL